MVVPPDHHQSVRCPRQGIRPNARPRAALQNRDPRHLAFQFGEQLFVAGVRDGVGADAAKEQPESHDFRQWCVSFHGPTS